MRQIITMNQFVFIFLIAVSALTFICCERTTVAKTDNLTSTGLRIAYVNGDSILMNFEEFRSESESMSERQRIAEEELQKKGAALEKEFMSYQQQAQKGTMTGKEMEARERYLSGKQEALLAERDKKAQEIMEETARINERLQSVMQEKLKEIKEKDGYDFIMSYVAGGPILIADEKYDITEQVLKELNKSSGDPVPVDTTGN